MTVKKAREPDAPVKSVGKKLRFSFNEQREFETIDSDISGLENDIAELTVQMERYASDYIKLQQLMAQKELLDKALEDKMERWVYLNDLAEKIAEGE